MFLAEYFQLRYSCNRSIGIEYFDQNSDGRKPGKVEQIKSSLGMTVPGEDAAFDRQKRIDMSGGIKIIDRA